MSDTTCALFAFEQLTQRGVPFVGAPSRASFMKSRFAADPWYWPDTTAV